MVLGLSLRHVLREFNVGRSMMLPLLRRGGTIAPPDACSFHEGMETLPRALLHRHRANIRLDMPVRRIARNGAGFVVTDSERIMAEHVVVTTPAGSGLTAPGRTSHQRPREDRHAQLQPADGRAPLRGDGPAWLGYQVSLAEPLITRGVTWNDSLFGRKGVYTVYLGGAKNPWVAQEPDEHVGSIAVNEFRTATGHDARVLSVEQELMPAWDRSWSAIQGLELPAGLHIHANWESRPGIPGRLIMARRLAERLAG
jgi:protoporphyrinogen/coproporphyrinogen III oxidase